MQNLFNRFVKDESGATAIEYGLIAAIMAVLLLAAFSFLDGPLQAAFQNIGNQLTNAGTAATINN
ncbi:Flp family type IVb pilin [Salinarimonas sp.]|uniref:Flp family type IVb pilin n=1 Tax=Salinarimonas sp. TaxID=2766526 RepID=UPI00391C68C2